MNTEEQPKEKKAGPKESLEMTAGAVWHEYEKARSYNEAIDLYNTVEKNEDFYIGEQWRGVHAPNLDKPVFNILARVVKFFISSIMSDDIGVSLEAFDETEEDKPMLDMVAEQMDAVMENTAYKKKCREVIRNAAVGQPYTRSGGNIYYATDREYAKLARGYKVDIFNWDDIDFNRWTFNTLDRPNVVPARKKVNKVKLFQVRVENEEPNELFGLTAIQVNYKRGGLVK